jgi:hypothetical protein
MARLRSEFGAQWATGAAMASKAHRDAKDVSMDCAGNAVYFPGLCMDIHAAGRK